MSRHFLKITMNVIFRDKEMYTKDYYRLSIRVKNGKLFLVLFTGISEKDFYVVIVPPGTTDNNT